MSKHQLTTIINTLNKEEIRSFKLYSSRISTGDGDNKTVRLFDLIKYDKVDEFDNEVVKLLFPKGNINAYYRLKNRLINDIEQSLLLIHRSKDDRFNIYKLIELANVFRYKSNYQVAFNYLQKAEKKAKQSEHLDLLNIIYDEINALAKDFYKIDPEIYITKKKENASAHSEKLQSEYLISTVSYKLVNSNYDFKTTDLQQELEEIQNTLALDPAVTQSLDVQFSVHKVIRTSLLQQKDWASLEKYLTDTYHEFEKNKFFNKKYFENKFTILNWIVNVSSINLKFEQSQKYAEILKDNLEKFNKKFYHKYLWMYHQSRVINGSFLGNNEDVTKFLEDIKANPKLKGTNFYDFFIHVNLAVGYFNAKKFDEGLKSLIPVLQGDTYSGLSKSLQLSINLVNLILHYANGDTIYLVNKISEIRRSFRKELKLESFAREKALISIIRSMATSADGHKSKRIRQQIQDFVDTSPKFEPGSNEAISYRLWLESIVNNRPYYDLVLESVGTRSQQV